MIFTRESTREKNGGTKLSKTPHNTNSVPHVDSKHNSVPHDDRLCKTGLHNRTFSLDAYCFLVILFVCACLCVLCQPLVRCSVSPCTQYGSFVWSHRHSCEHLKVHLEILATGHSIPCWRPSPVLAEHGCKCHTRSLMLIKPIASET